MSLKNSEQYIAEFIGTFFLVFFGCGAIIVAETIDPTIKPFIPIIFGGVISVMIYAMGHISGAHFNPAVTLAFWSCKKLPGHRLVGYILAQLTGAILASFAHKLVFTGQHSFGSNWLEASLSAGITLEMILSFALMLVITSVATDSRAVGELAGIAIGTTVTLCAFVGGGLTGASMNPARSLGPAIVSGQLDGLWLYLVVPVIGCILGAKTYFIIQCQKQTESNSQGCC